MSVNCYVGVLYTKLIIKMFSYNYDAYLMVLEEAL